MKDEEFVLGRFPRGETPQVEELHARILRAVLYPVTVEVREVDHLFALFQRPQFARNDDKCDAGCGLQDCPPVRIEAQTVLPHL